MACCMQEIDYLQYTAYLLFYAGEMPVGERAKVEAP